MFLGPERNRFIVKRAGQKSEFVSDHVYSIIFDQPKRRRVDRGLRLAVSKDTKYVLRPRVLRLATEASAPGFVTRCCVIFYLAV